MLTRFVKRAAQPMTRAIHTTRVLSASPIPTVSAAPDSQELHTKTQANYTDTVPEAVMSGTFEQLTQRKAYIYRPAKNAMQSRPNASKAWSISLEPTDRWTNPLMGWPSSEDAQFNQITRMDFETEEEAVHYAKSQGLDFVLMDCPEPSFKPKSYSANFKWKGEPKKK